LTIKKIPQAVLARCEYGHDDYSLQVENLPAKGPAVSGPPVDELTPTTTTRKTSGLQIGLFGEEKP